jgi:hypothetical protein
MIDGMVELFCQEEILGSASFVEFSFWTETWWIYLEVFQDAHGVDILDLRVY